MLYESDLENVEDRIQFMHILKKHAYKYDKDKYFYSKKEETLEIPIFFHITPDEHEKAKDEFMKLKEKQHAKVSKIVRATIGEIVQKMDNPKNKKKPKKKKVVNDSSIQVPIMSATSAERTVRDILAGGPSRLEDGKESA